MFCAPFTVCVPQAFETNATWCNLHSNKEKVPLLTLCQKIHTATQSQPGGPVLVAVGLIKHREMPVARAVHSSLCAWPAGHRVPWTGQVADCFQCYLSWQPQLDCHPQDMQWNLMMHTNSKETHYLSQYIVNIKQIFSSFCLEKHPLQLGITIAYSTGHTPPRSYE